STLSRGAAGLPLQRRAGGRRDGPRRPRRRHYPGVLPAYRCNGVLAVAEMARAGLGLAAIPAYLLRDGDGLRVLDADLEGCASALWLLTRPDCRALRSVVALFDELGRHVRLGDE
ncbi:LysR substrate-binding domain-containing protein, partial [Pseudomonas aeruginosa]|uniref:LysR substrate-binding domain-containing protein n=1 Tax=Pseudomonas aeruginosa TaxID=287 RepID=UPI001FB70A26